MGHHNVMCSGCTVHTSNIYLFLSSALFRSWMFSLSLSLVRSVALVHSIRFESISFICTNGKWWSSRCDQTCVAQEQLIIYTLTSIAVYASIQMKNENLMLLFALLFASFRNLFLYFDVHSTFFVPFQYNVYTYNHYYLISGWSEWAIPPLQQWKVFFIHRHKTHYYRRYM